MPRGTITKVKINPLKAVEAFNKATLFVCEGQAYDKEFEHNHGIVLDQYLTMIKKKTGWMIGFSAELGGILGDQPNSIINELQSYGLNLGMAFQIQDDIIEAYSVLNGMGIAHSAESYKDGKLVGGLYGVVVGRGFCGACMFSLVSDASKSDYDGLIEHCRYGG